MFTRAIVRTPCEKLTEGLTTANLGKPDFEKALEQHSAYVEALKTCGLEVIVLEADNNYPDSVFVEDTAVLTPKCAIVANPGAPSRRGEVGRISEVLKDYYTDIEYIKDPGTLEGGDILEADSHYYIGRSSRTNLEGANQFSSLLSKYGITSTIIPVEEYLHLKSGISSYLDGGNLVACGKFLHMDEFKKYNLIEVDDDERYAANCVWINGFVLLPEGFPKIRKSIESLGYKTIVIDVSEFRKLSGGLSCLSLRF